MDVVALIAQLEDNSTRVRETLIHLDLDEHVSTCPGWTVRDLVHHLSCTQRWATDIVAEARTHQHWMELDNYELPDDDGLAGWFTEGANRLADSLNEASDDLDCWVFMSDVESPLHFWSRRQAHETAIHRIDMEVAAGQLSGCTPAAAADGLDELVTGFWARPNRGPRATIATSIGFCPSDHDGRWTAFFDTDMCTATRAVDTDQVQVTAHGAIADLFTWAWDRPTLTPLTFEGDGSAIERLKSGKG